MINNIRKDAENRMKKCIEIFKNYTNKIHTGRISPNLLNNIQVKCYGMFTPLRQLASIVAENSYTLAITVFDNKIISLVEKAIMDSELGLNPVLHNDSIIRISSPSLTEERRKSLVKMIRIETERCKISLRKIRRDSNDKIKYLLKDKIISEDKEHCYQNDVQKLTNFWIKEVDIIFLNKEKELMQFH
ncbi:ribosome recycling factor [Blochmannia endosymbiont of Colobopsis nipponica]|uniref:ribosome recycling factor n=1 Tax=Blochmannia endosymbiont of Colobopsis nipponica TaxID=2681987 RepID=UPI00177B2D5A|nr:ribosome recycling factor [Blochmannia endosymbiont of Colobopsis nipponica]QOI11161.1 ribosome recycling factor [Blochmannia endosymbiont of Colobopsis nipponica]